MANERFQNEPPGWDSYEELLENLVYYLIENSSYAELAKEEMPPEMLEEMQKTMVHFANAIWHDLSKEGIWELFRNGQLLSPVGGEMYKVNLIEGDGIKITPYWTEQQDPDDEEKVIRTLNLKIDTGTDGEAGRRENLQSHDVRVDFKREFKTIPVGEEPQVYRINKMFNGNWRKENVGFWYTSPDWIDHLGFNLTIDPDEDLAGIIIEYEFEEQS